MKMGYFYNEDEGQLYYEELREVTLRYRLVPDDSIAPNHWNPPDIVKWDTKENIAVCTAKMSASDIGKFTVNTIKRQLQRKAKLAEKQAATADIVEEVIDSYQPPSAELT